MMPYIYKTILESVKSGELVSSSYRQDQSWYGIYTRQLASTENSWLCMTIVRDTTSESRMALMDSDYRIPSDKLPEDRDESINDLSYYNADAYLENSIALIVVRLISGNTPESDDFQYIYVNDAYCRMMGIDKEVFAGRRFREVFGRNADPDWPAMVARCVRGQKRVTGRKVCNFTVHNLEYTAVPISKEGYCSIAIVDSDVYDSDTDSRWDDSNAYEEGVLNMAITRAIGIEDPNESINELIAYSGKFLRVDRAYIFELEDGYVDNTYEWCRDGVNPEIDNLQHLPAKIYGRVWMEKMRNHQDLIIKNLDEFAAIDKNAADILRPQGIDRLISAPLFVENRLIGFIGIDNPPLRSIDGIARVIDAFAGFAAALIRHRDNTRRIIQISRQEQIIHEAIMQALRMDTPDNEIYELISTIGSQMLVDRVYIFEKDRDGSISNTYEWCAPGVTEHKEKYQRITPGAFGSTFVDTLEKQENVVVRDAGECADEYLKGELYRRDVSRVILSPLFQQQELIGFIGLDNPDIKNEENTAILLDMLAGLCVGLIQNRDAFLKIKHDAYYESELNKASIRALMTDDPDEAISNYLAQISRTVAADRAYICEYGKDKNWTCSYGWSADGGDPKDDPLAIGRIKIFEAEWRHRMSRRSIIAVSGPEVVSGKLEELMRFSGISRMIYIPIFVSGYRGFVGFENPAAETMSTPYSRYELAASFIGVHLRHRRNVYYLRDLSYKDQMTGIGNRRALTKFSYGLDPEKPIGLIYCDLNELKEMNDKYGHDAGDEMIMSFCRTMKDNCPSDDRNGYFRIGGDEFLIAMSGMSEREFNRDYEEFKRILENRGISVAMGAVWKPGIHDPFDAIMNEADLKMYEEKRKYHEKKAAMTASMQTGA